MHLKSKVEKQVYKRTLKRFLDLLILSKLENSEPLGGYDFIRLIHEQFGVLISSGVIYYTLSILEREGFIKGYTSQTKRVYKITNKSKQFIEAAHRAMDSVQDWIEQMTKK